MHRDSSASVLFVGAAGRMEMQRVPAAGYEIVGLPVRGLVRPLYSWKNLGVLLAFYRSRRQAKTIVRDFAPDIAVGVGGYASAPTLDAAYSLGVPCLLQEQNSYAGVTNKSLAKKACRICVAYDGMEKFFPKEKLLLTGNPVRQELVTTTMTKVGAAKVFGLCDGRPVVLVVGGSLGAKTLNESILGSLDLIRHSEVNVLWQTGAYYYDSIMSQLASLGTPSNLIVTAFVNDMCAAYTAADLVVSRAGASSISELCLLAKPSILVPSPNVAEDHQTKNAMALVRRGAALMVKDSAARDELVPLAINTVLSVSQLQSLSANASAMALPDAADIIAREIIDIIDSNKR